MPPRSKRRKRDTAENLYRHCRLGGDCIPDVVNKFEQKTPADRILQIGGSLTYFGGQGIGTGRGSGGSTGYRPLPGGAGSGGGRGTGVRVGGVPTIIRRPVGAIDTLGSVDVQPIDAASGSEVPSIIPLEEGPVPEPDITVGGDNNVVGGEVVVPSVSGGPSVSTGEEGGEAAILEVGNTSTAGQGERVSTQEFSNPAFVALAHSTPSTGEGTYGTSVLVFPSEGGTFIGGGRAPPEEIPLQSFSTSVVSDPGIPGPRTSTPRVAETSFPPSGRGAYGRRIQQVPISDPNFLGRPRTLATFDNPAFVGDDSFVLPLREEVEAPPHEAFQDLHRMGRLTFSKGLDGRLRVGRMGTKATMRLRSGTHIGPRVHYYQDVSTIDNIGSIELSVFGEQSGESTIVLDTSESTFVNVPLQDAEEEALLLDDLQEDFSNAQLSFQLRGRTVQSEQPQFRETLYRTPMVDDVGDGVFVSYPEEGARASGDRTHVPMDGRPSLLWDPSTGTFDLHPSMIPWRRRRRRHELV
nr:late protein 2 [Felis catus papillomavirus]